MRNYVILDRDGTLIRHVHYLCEPAKVALLPGVAEGLRRLRAAGCLLFLHTNQSGVARGLFTLADAVACNDRMIEQIGLGQQVFADICIAPEAPGDPLLLRKPSPHFGRAIMAEYGARPDNLFYVGDNITDLQTARNLGCHGIGVSTGVSDLRDSGFPVFDDFLGAALHIINQHSSESTRDDDDT